MNFEKKMWTLYNYMGHVWGILAWLLLFTAIGLAVAWFL